LALSINAGGLFFVILVKQGRETDFRRAQHSLKSAYHHWKKVEQPLDSTVIIALEGMHGLVPKPEISKIMIGNSMNMTLFSLPSERAGGKGKLCITTNGFMVVIAPNEMPKLVE